MLILLIDTENNVFGCEEEKLAQLGGDSEEKCHSPLNVRGVFSTDG